MSRKRRKEKKFTKIVLLFIIVGLLGGACGAYGFSLLHQIKNVELPNNDGALGIQGNGNKNSKIVNIAFFGLDRREASDTTRADSIMIATLDKEHKKIKLTSIMRDTYVDIPGKGMDKINHSYAYGGPELAVQTINRNFNMNIKDFVAVDFYGLENIIDSMGGIEIDVQPAEIKYINYSVGELDKVTHSQSPMISTSGNQLLTGRQAVAYSRIRAVGNGDYGRTERQRVVLEKVLNKGMNLKVTQYPKLLNSIVPNLETSLSKTQILGLGTSTVTSGIREMQQYRIPVDGYAQHKRVKGVFYLIPDSLEDNINLLHEFIYEDNSSTYR